MTDSARRFLIIRLSSIGDIVNGLPAAAALAESFPQAQIDWVIEKRYALLLKGNPHLHRVIELDTLGWRGQFTSSACRHEILSGLGALRESHYEAVLDFQGLWKSAVIARLTRAQERIGLAEPWMREPGAAVLYTRKISPPRGAHVVAESLALVEGLGARPHSWQFPLPHTPEDDAYVESQLAALGCDHFIIINPGGGWRSKCWSPENYSSLIQRLEGVLTDHIVLTGSPSEEPVISQILQSAGARRAGYLPTTLVQLIALVRRARLFISGDTGPLHLAAAVGTPIVGIYGPTDPARNGPFASADIALYQHGPINHTRRGASPPYVRGISVESVAAAVAKRLERIHG